MWGYSGYSCPAPIMDKSLELDRSLCPVRPLCYYLDRTSQLRQNKELIFVSFKKGYYTDISCHYLMDEADCDPMFELSDQEVLALHQVKAHDVRVFATSKAFQSGVSLEQLLSARHWKSTTSSHSFSGGM